RGRPDRLDGDDLALERLVGKGRDVERDRITNFDFTDIGLVDLGHDLEIVQVHQGEDGGGGRGRSGGGRDRSAGDPLSHRAVHGGDRSVKRRGQRRRVEV